MMRNILTRSSQCCVSVAVLIALQALTGLIVGSLVVIPVRLTAASDSKAHDQYLHAAKLFEQDKYDGAIAALKSALQLYPKFPEAYRLLGKVYFEGLRRPSDAVKAFRKAIELKPEYAEAYYDLGIVDQAQGKLTAAEPGLRPGDQVTRQ